MYWRYKSAVKAILGVLAGFAVIGAIVIGGWKGGWWLQNASASHQYQIQQNGVQNQDTLRQQIDKGFVQIIGEDVQVVQAKGDTALIGQIRVEEANQAYTLCQQMEQVAGVPLPGDQADWYSSNCTDGSVAPASVYYIPIIG
jgi:hypothetical protein